jgi:hypothetical protein
MREDPVNEQAYDGPTVPMQYAGMWIVWNFEGTRIITSGRTFEDAERAAKGNGETRPVFSKVPKRRLIWSPRCTKKLPRAE